MPRTPTRQKSGSSIDLAPLGSGGLDQNTDRASLPREALSLARNVILQSGVERCRGFVKVAQLDDAGASYGAKVFGSDTKYASFVPPLIGLGGFAFPFHFTAVRGAVNTVLLTSWVSHALFGNDAPIRLELGSTGNFTAYVSWEGRPSGAPTSITAPTLTADAAYHGLLVYDDLTGYLTLYLNGDVAGTVAVGRGLQPMQNPDVTWYVGINFDPTMGAVSGSGFLGAVDGFAMMSLAGVNLEDEDTTIEPVRPSLLTELRRRNWQDWGNPVSGMLLFQYGFDEEQVEEPDTSGVGVMYDSSERQNHGVYHGAPTNHDRVAIRAQNGQHVGTVRRAALGDLSDGRVNVAVAGGGVFYEVLNTGA